MDRQAFFADRLEMYGDAIALVDAQDGRISYRDLATRADAFAVDLVKPGLMLIETANTVEAIIAYLGALRASVPVILASDGPARSAISDAFQPDYVYSRQTDGEWRLQVSKTCNHASHPDLAVLLSTSGSTGSPKLVRLSRGNVNANALSIAEYLEIEPGRVAVTNLPVYYSYGLSVVNSFLAVGATVVLTEESVVENDFWARLSRHGVTDLAGVPYTYELLERIGFRDRDPGALRVLTQAGGRLPPELVERYVDHAKAKSMQFFVMYGQTEATARMAYLPPALAAANSDCIGIAIPGGRFRIEDAEGGDIAEPGQSGELVYEGPNVMMGYALSRDDLALDAGLGLLRTGDIAEFRENRLIRIVGRASRFSKIAGLRIGFDDVETLVRGMGGNGYVTGNDALVAICLDSGDPDYLRSALAERCRIPATSLICWKAAEVPTLGTGKIDYRTILAEGLRRVSEGAKIERAGRSVSDLYARSLNRSEVNQGQSLAELEADSLSYMTVSLGLEELIGDLPGNWQDMSVGELQLLVDAAGGPARKASMFRTIGMDAPLRLLAISLVFVGHGSPGHTEFLRGGSSMLFMLAGYSMASMQFSALMSGQPWSVMTGMLKRLIVPYMLFVTLLLLMSDAARSSSWYLMTSVFVLTPVERGPLFSYWFIETLLHMTFLVCILFSSSKFRRLFDKNPYVISIGLMLLATAMRQFGAYAWPNGNELNLTFDGWAYTVFAGFGIAFAKTRAQVLLLAALGFVLAIEHFGPATGRSYWFALSLLVLGFVPTLRLPTHIARAVVLLASATYFMYLAHPLVVHVVLFILEPATPIAAIMLVYTGSVAVGVICFQAWKQIMNLVRPPLN